MAEACPFLSFLQSALSLVALGSDRDLDIWFDGHSRTQEPILVEIRLVVVVEIDAHGNALDDFDVVSCCVLRRQQAVLGASGSAYAGDMTFPRAAAVGVDFYFHRLTRLHVP